MIDVVFMGLRFDIDRRWWRLVLAAANWRLLVGSVQRSEVGPACQLAGSELDALDREQIVIIWRCSACLLLVVVVMVVLLVIVVVVLMRVKLMVVDVLARVQVDDRLVVVLLRAQQLLAFMLVGGGARAQYAWHGIETLVVDANLLLLEHGPACALVVVLVAANVLVSILVVVVTVAAQQLLVVRIGAVAAVIQ
jgi:hypothetical protein